MQTENTDITDEEVGLILYVIFDKYGYDFRDYSHASIYRRISRYMEERKYTTAAQLITQLRKDPSEFELFLQRITVNVTEMFRDPEFYTVLAEKVLPLIATYPIIKIWHAGCSSGEEVFSLAILLHEAGLLQRSKIYATDINPLNIEKAKKGILLMEGMKEYTSNYIKAGGKEDFASYYTARYNHAIINKDLRNSILFSQHNLVTDQVFNEFQLILCRNVMIYFNKDLQNKVIRLFYNSLSTFGFLALGIKESLLFSDLKDNFENVAVREKIYRRIR